MALTVPHGPVTGPETAENQRKSAIGSAAGHQKRAQARIIRRRRWRRCLPHRILFFKDGMPRLTSTAFAALLARANVSQAAFARLAGITPRQMNKWCRGHAAVPVWAGLIAAMLLERSPEALAIDLEEASQECSLPDRPSG